MTLATLAIGKGAVRKLQSLGLWNHRFSELARHVGRSSHAPGFNRL